MDNWKGTQTDWKIENPLKRIVSIRFSDGKDCDLYLHQYENSEELLANAQIMVTSRELLKALNNMVEWYGKYEDHECEMIGNQILCKEEDQEEIIQFSMKVINKALGNNN
ncbi:MAG: nicotinic acid mononucleotide adenylyltransferase [Sulfurimonas sp.]|jgi:nicotinic acid mononucleotide adenylyltransferase